MFWVDIFQPCSGVLLRPLMRQGDLRDTTFSVLFSSELGLRQRCIRLSWRGIRPGSGSANSFAVGFSNRFVILVLRPLFTFTHCLTWADLMC